MHGLENRIFQRIDPFIQCLFIEDGIDRSGLGTAAGAVLGGGVGAGIGGGLGAQFGESFGSI